MPAFNGSGTLKKKGKRCRIQKERELDKNFRIGTVKAIIGGKHASVVLSETNEIIECLMPKGIRVKYRVKDEVKINIYNELIGKITTEKENIECETIDEEEEKTVDMNQYNKEIKKTPQTNPRERTREIRQENDVSESESETSEEDSDTESCDMISDEKNKDDDFFD